MSHYVKDAHGYDVKVPGQGQVNLNTVLGAVGAYGALGGNIGGNGLLGNLFGNNRGGYPSPMDAPISRYEMAMQQTIAAKDSEIMELKANIFTDTKIADVYERLTNRISAAEAVLAQQAIRNQGFTDAFRELQKDIDYKVALEAERRQCADCKIVDYANSTFATKLVTEYGAGTASAPLPTYNPLSCGSPCGCNG